MIVAISLSQEPLCRQNGMHFRYHHAMAAQFLGAREA